MNLQVLVAVAEIVSALAVTFTLLALIISVRQNTRSQKALVVDSLAAAIASINVRQWSPMLSDLPSLKRRPIGVQPAAKSESWRTTFSFLSSSCRRTLGINRKPAFWISRCGLDGRHCFENTTTAMACAGYGGRGANTRIRQSFKGFFQEQRRRTSLAA